MIVERIDLDNKEIKPQTIAHHKERYRFACKVRKPKGLAIDLGCGTGYGTDMLRKAGYNVTGLDISVDAIGSAHKNYPKCRFLATDLTSMSFHDADLIVFFEVIEHLPFKKGVALLGEIRKALKPNGVFILSTPRDINDKYNRMHKSEWPYHLLKNELGNFFSDVRLYGQDWDTAEINEEDVRNNDFFIAVCKI